VNQELEQDLKNIDSLLKKAKLQGLAFLESLSERPTSVNQTVVLNSKLNEIGIGAEASLKLFNEKFEKLMVSSAGPRFLGFVTGGATPAAILGDWLTTIYDQNTHSTKGQGDISAIIEMETTKLLLD
jgi:hypothetical protein